MFIHDSNRIQYEYTYNVWINYIKVELLTSSSVVFDWGWLRNIITTKPNERITFEQGEERSVTFTKQKENGS